MSETNGFTDWLGVGVCMKKEVDYMVSIANEDDAYEAPKCCTCVYWKPRDATGEIGTCMEGWEHNYTPYAHSCINWEPV